MGVSRDSHQKQLDFARQHQLNFPLISDPDGKIILAWQAPAWYGLARRWTFILDPELTIRWMDTNVNPSEDPARVRAALQKLMGRPEGG